MRDAATLDAHREVERSDPLRVMRRQDAGDAASDVVSNERRSLQPQPLEQTADHVASQGARGEAAVREEHGVALAVIDSVDRLPLHLGDCRQGRAVQRGAGHGPHTAS